MNFRKRRVILLFAFLSTMLIGGAIFVFWPSNNFLDQIISTGSRVRCIAFAPSGRHLAAGLANGCIALVDLDSFAISTLPPKAASIVAIAFSTDGNRVAMSCEDGSTQILEISTGRICSDLSRQSSTKDATPTIVNALDYSNDGTKIATGDSNGVLSLWDSKSGTHLSTIANEASDILSLQFSDERPLLAWRMRTGETCIWDVAASKLIQRFGVEALASPRFRLAIMPGANSVITNSESKMIEIRDVYTGTVTNSWQVGGRSPVQNIAISVDGITFATLSIGGIVDVWDIETKRHLMSIDHWDVTSMAFDPSKRWLVTGGKAGKLKMWKMQSITRYSH